MSSAGYRPKRRLPLAKDLNEVQQALLRLRSRLGLTQQALAVQLGIAITTVARWETSRPPRGAMLLKLAWFSTQKNCKEEAAIFQKHVDREITGDVEEDVWAWGVREILRHRSIPAVAEAWTRIYPLIKRAIGTIAENVQEDDDELAMITSDLVVLSGWANHYRDQVSDAGRGTQKGRSKK